MVTLGGGLKGIVPICKEVSWEQGFLHIYSYTTMYIFFPQLVGNIHTIAHGMNKCKISTPPGTGMGR